MNRVTRVSSLIQRRFILPPQVSRIPLRNVEDKIKEREMALEDDYVRRYEKERVEIEKSKNEVPKMTKPKNKKSKPILLSETNGKDKFPGRLSDSGIIF